MFLPPVLAAISSLVGTSGCVAWGKGRRTRLNIYTMIVAASGSRKSEAYKIVKAALGVVKESLSARSLDIQTFMDKVTAPELLNQLVRNGDGKASLLLLSDEGSFSYPFLDGTFFRTMMVIYLRML